MDGATRRHFFHHGRSDPSVSAEEIDSCHWCQIRSFDTHKTHPITIVNTRDDAVIPPKFRFIDKSVFGVGVEPAAANFRSGCDCVDNEDCMYNGCHCLQEIDPSDEEDGGANATNGDGPRKKMFAYHSHGARAGMLRSKNLDSRVPIYECHEGCACTADCPNRVVERGRRVPLQIFRTENRGWGVCSLAEIKEGQFVDRYLGEIITSEEAESRRDDSDVSKRKDVYLFALDKFSDAHSLDPRLAGPPVECDGEYMSGPTRFVNHSCDPNMRIFARVGDHADRHIHDLALFAIRDIPKGEELTFDYVDGLMTMRNDAKDPSQRDTMTVCLCGSQKCRGFLW